MSGTKRGLCLVCDWRSRYSRSIIGALYLGLKHVNKDHPEAEGFVVAAIIDGDQLLGS